MTSEVKYSRPETESVGKFIDTFEKIYALLPSAPDSPNSREFVSARLPRVIISLRKEGNFFRVVVSKHRGADIDDPQVDSEIYKFNNRGDLESFDFVSRRQLMTGLYVDQRNAQWGKVGLFSARQPSDNDGLHFNYLTMAEFLQEEWDAVSAIETDEGSPPDRRQAVSN